MFKRLWNYLNIYRLIMVYLVGLLVVAIVLSAKGVLPFSPWSLIGSVVLLLFVSSVTNEVFAWAFDTRVKYNSVIIAALILALIISPIKSGADFWLLFFAAALAMGSKYILAIKKVHIFNPAAIAVVITALVVGQSASWWVGTSALLPYVVFGGILVVSKIRRWDMVWYFSLTVFVTTFLFSAFKGADVLTAARHVLFDSSLCFFAFAMLTEPMTTPPGKKWQIVYGILVGVLFSPQIHFGSVYLTPELALVLGNIFVYVVKPNSIFAKRRVIPISNNVGVPPAN